MEIKEGFGPCRLPLHPGYHWHTTAATADQLSQEGGEKRGHRFDPPKSSPATDNVEQNAWSNYKHTPPTLKWVGTRAARPNTWGGVAFTIT